eukprot:45247_1
MQLCSTPMAQPLQPGNEGNDDEKEVSQYGIYQCVFRQASDSLYIMMKDRKTKRSFTNTFSKSTLVEMDLKQSMDKVVKMLETAKSGSASELKFEIRFGDAENTKKTSADKLSKSYEKGNALYMFVSLEHSYFSAEYQFKLLEQKRNETDILRDIISDMQDEIDQLKLFRNNNTGVAVWNLSSSPPNGILPLDHVTLASTLKGMVQLSDDKKTVSIGISGLYKITATLNFSATGCQGDNIIIKLNGNEVSGRYASSGSYGSGTVDYVNDLKKGDTIQFYANCIETHKTDPKWNSFKIQKL